MTTSTTIMMPAGQRTETPSRKSLRYFQIFPGRNKFCFDGRLMVAPDILFCVLAHSLLLLCCGLFWGFDCPYLVANLSPAIPVFSVYLFVMTLLFLGRTTLSDPGIVPRSHSDEAIYESPSAGRLYPTPKRYLPVQINGQEVFLKWCFSCKMFRPPRTCHCARCDNCVERFDHHCPWVANCIGARNYRYFYFYLLFISLCAMYHLSFAVTHVALLSYQVTGSPAFFIALGKTPASAIVALVALFALLGTAPLFVMHSRYVVKNWTTNEDIKWNAPQIGTETDIAPLGTYSLGKWYLNCAYILFSTPRPSTLHLRQIAPTSASTAYFENQDNSAG